MFPILPVGPLSINSSILILLLGLWIALWVGEKAYKPSPQTQAPYYNLVLLSLLAGLIGARIGYAVLNVSVFLENPSALIVPTPYMLDLPAGILSAILTALIYGNRRGLKLWQVLDHLTPSAAVFMIAIHLANLASGDAYGVPANVPWCIHLWGACRHPTQIYATVLATGIATLVFRFPNNGVPAGLRFWILVGLTALARLLIEPFRGDSVAWGVFRQAQIIAGLTLYISLFQITKRFKSFVMEQGYVPRR